MRDSGFLHKTYSIQTNKTSLKFKILQHALEENLILAFFFPSVTGIFFGLIYSLNVSLFLNKLKLKYLKNFFTCNKGVIWSIEVVLYLIQKFLILCAGNSKDDSLKNYLRNFGYSNSIASCRVWRQRENCSLII